MAFGIDTVSLVLLSPLPPMFVTLVYAGCVYSGHMKPIKCCEKCIDKICVAKRSDEIETITFQPSIQPPPYKTKEEYDVLPFAESETKL